MQQLSELVTAAQHGELRQCRDTHMLLPREQKMTWEWGTQSSSVWTEGPLPKRQTSALALQHGQAVPGTAPRGRSRSPTPLEPRRHHRAAALPCWGHLEQGRRHCQLSAMTTPHDSVTNMNHGKGSPGKRSSICWEAGDTADCVCIHSWLFLGEAQIQNRALAVL